MAHLKSTAMTGSPNLENAQASIDLSSSKLRGKRQQSPDQEPPGRAVKRTAAAGEVIKEEPEDISLSEPSTVIIATNSSAQSAAESVAPTRKSDMDGEVVKHEPEDQALSAEITPHLLENSSIQSVDLVKSEADREYDLDTSLCDQSTLRLHPVFLQDTEPDQADGTRCFCRGVQSAGSSRERCGSCFRFLHHTCVWKLIRNTKFGDLTCPSCLLRMDLGTSPSYATRLLVTYQDHSEQADNTTKIVDMEAMIRTKSQKVLYRRRQDYHAPGHILLTLVHTELEDRNHLDALKILQRSCLKAYNDEHWAMLHAVTKIVTRSYYDRVEEDTKLLVIPSIHLAEISDLCDESTQYRFASLAHYRQFRGLLVVVAMELGIASDPSFIQAIKDSHRAAMRNIRYILEGDYRYLNVYLLRGKNACQILDLLQEFLDSAGYPDGYNFYNPYDYIGAAKQMILRLSTESGELPSSLFLKRVETTAHQLPVGEGAHADVYGGEYDGGQVVLKRLRMFSGLNYEDHHKKLCREALPWRQLRHPNIVPFLGLDCDTYAPFPCMVSPLMKGGTLFKHLERHATHSIDVLPYISDIVKGLCYLHGQKFVHGDLRAANVFVNDKGHACISDFGLISFIESIDQASTTMGGNPRWMAPELQIDEDPHRTFASDIYSFGCLCLEIITRKKPFADIRLDITVSNRIISGVRPNRPPAHEFPRDIPPDALWNMISKCWLHDPLSRPSTSQVREWVRWVPYG